LCSIGDDQNLCREDCDGTPPSEILTATSTTSRASGAKATTPGTDVTEKSKKRKSIKLVRDEDPKLDEDNDEEPSAKRQQQQQKVRDMTSMKFLIILHK